MLSNIGIWTGIVGGIVGAVAGVLALWDRWKHRHPRLLLFAPYSFSGVDIGNGRKCLNVLCRLSNSSQKAAFIYLETMKVELAKAGNWHVVQRVDFPKGQTPKTDFSSSEKIHFGVDDVPYFSRFGTSVISRDNPFSGYLCVISDQEDILQNPTKLRISIRDCHFKEHIVKVDFAEQKKQDPHKPIQPQPASPADG